MEVPKVGYHVCQFAICPNVVMCKRLAVRTIDSWSFAGHFNMHLPNLKKQNLLHSSNLIFQKPNLHFPKLNLYLHTTKFNSYAYKQYSISNYCKSNWDGNKVILELFSSFIVHCHNIILESFSTFIVHYRNSTNVSLEVIGGGKAPCKHY